MGKAAEHLVCADLLMKGYNAFLSDQGLPYDVVIDLGRRLVRVQVKGTAKPKNPMPGLRISDGYFFHVRRAGRGRRRVYGDDEFDVYALVALDIYAVAYFARDELDSQTICLRVPGVTYGPGGRLARRFEDGSLTRAIETLLDRGRSSVTSIVLEEEPLSEERPFGSRGLASCSAARGAGQARLGARLACPPAPRHVQGGRASQC